MPISTNNNIMALNVRRVMNKNQSFTDRKIESLGSGLRIHRAENDAAGLSISEGLRSELTKLSQNVRNAEMASDLLRVAEGSLNETHSVLQRMRQLAIQASNGHLIDSQRQILTAEFNQSSAALDRIAQATVYNNRVLLAGFARVDEQNSTAITDGANTGVISVELSGAEEGTYSFIDATDSASIVLGNGVSTQTLNLGTILQRGRVADGTQIIANFDRLGIQMTLAGFGAADGVDNYIAGDLNTRSLVVAEGSGGSFLVGPTDAVSDQLQFDLPDLRASGDVLNLDRVSLASQESARLAIGVIDAAITTISLERGGIGALVNRLTHAVTFSENEIENVQHSESTLRDTDVAIEATALARARILTDTSSAMLTQAFTSVSRVLQLL